jgi:hypothetical protein
MKSIKSFQHISFSPTVPQSLLRHSESVISFEERKRLKLER